MPRNAIKLNRRRAAILEKLETDRLVSVTALAEEMGVTVVTIRSDLDAMEQEGLLRRVSGGAVPVLSNKNAPSRNAQNTAEKQKIACAVAAQIKDGDVLFINSGTTTHAVALALKHKKNLNIVTNSIAVALELGSIPTFRVILLGGEINSNFAFTYGVSAQEQLDIYRVDCAILTLDGISTAEGLTTYHPEEILINSMMMQRAKKVIIVADHSKIGRAGFTCFGQAGKDICLVTDGGADPDVLNALQNAGVSITIAE